MLFQLLRMYSNTPQLPLENRNIPWEESIEFLLRCLRERENYPKEGWQEMECYSNLHLILENKIFDRDLML